MLLALIVLVWILISLQKYAKGQGVTSAPKGFQNAVEPVITKGRYSKPNLGPKYKKYLLYLLTIFFLY